MILEHGIGLLLWQNEWTSGRVKRPEAFVDVIGAKKSKKVNKSIREMVMKKLAKVDSERTAENHKQLTLAQE